MVVTSDLVLHLSEEASLLLSLDSSIIDNPFLIFEELSVLDESFVNIGLTMYSGSTLDGNTGTKTSVKATSGSASFSDLSSLGSSTDKVSIAMSVGVSVSMVVHMTFTVDVSVSLDDGLLNNFGDNWL